MAASGIASNSELLNVLGDVKARMQDKVGIVDFPMPQFILIGKQSVGKSSLIEALAGERFNFTSGTLGSRRPTVLEFRNVPALSTSRWSVRDRETNRWMEYPIASVMGLVEQAHEELGSTVSSDPIYVRVESASCVDMQIVDLPGFRDFASDPSKQHLSDKIAQLVLGFMKDRRNVMLCVEQAGDAATMSTLAKCREIDPRFERTILIRNKLDKYYQDLESGNINQWVHGFGDLPSNLVSFALTLPWQEQGSRSFAQLRSEANDTDVRTLQSKGLSSKYMRMIGFNSFTSYMEMRIEQLFAESIGPVLRNLNGLKESSARRTQELTTEIHDTNPDRILSTTCDCGTSFATALAHVMGGVLQLKGGHMTLMDELKAFHEDCRDSIHFDMLPSVDFKSLDDYIEYLRGDIQVGACEIAVNGGAQFRRLMIEVEIFLRFSEISVETSKRDVIQARGVSMGALTWRDVVAKLLSNEGHVPLQRKVLYVGERLKWFFEKQKDVILDFMFSLSNTAIANMYSPLYHKHAMLIKKNEMIKHLVYQTYDAACKRQLQHFVELFDNVLSSTFSNPWVFLKGAAGSSAGATSESGDASALPSFAATKERLPHELQSQSGVDDVLTRWLQDIPTGPHEIDLAVERVQAVVLKTYSFIRSQVCDQVEMFAESFFKLPMMRRLEEDMSKITLTDDDKYNYESRRERLIDELQTTQTQHVEVNECLDMLQAFKSKTEARCA